MTTTTPTTIQNIRLFLITPSPLNPRKTIDEDSLKELAANIEKQGLLQPITVRPVSPASSRPSPLPPPPFSSVPSFVHSPLSSPLSSIPPAESRANTPKPCNDNPSTSSETTSANAAPHADTHASSATDSMSRCSQSAHSSQTHTTGADTLSPSW